MKNEGEIPKNESNSSLEILLFNVAADISRKTPINVNEDELLDEDLREGTLEGLIEGFNALNKVKQNEFLEVFASLDVSEEERNRLLSSDNSIAKYLLYKGMFLTNSIDDNTRTILLQDRSFLHEVYIQDLREKISSAERDLEETNLQELLNGIKRYSPEDVSLFLENWVSIKEAISKEDIVEAVLNYYNTFELESEPRLYFELYKELFESEENKSEVTNLVFKKLVELPAPIIDEFLKVYLARQYSHLEQITDEEIETLMSKSTVLWTNLYYIPKNWFELKTGILSRVLTEKEEDEVLQYLDTYSSREDYLYLTRLLKITPSELKGKFSSSINFQDLYYQNVVNKRPNDAFFLLQSAKVCGIPLYTLTENKEANPQPKETYGPYREIYEEVDVQKETVKFYLAVKTLRELDQLFINLKDEQDDVLYPENKELSKVKDKIVLNEIRKKCEDTINHTATWMKLYCVKAITSELQNYKGLKETSPTPNSYPYVDFYTTATEQKIFRYLTYTSTIFNDSSERELWGGLAGYQGFGGPSWGEIAKQSSLLWFENNSTKDLLFLVDTIFSLEHNGGKIFDKDPQYVLFNEPQLTEILNKSFETDLDEFYTFVKESNLLSSDDLGYFNDLYKQVQKLKKAPKKAESYE